MTKKELEKKNKELEKKILELQGIKTETILEIKTYSFSQIKDIDLDNLVDICDGLNDDIFNEWFNNGIDLDDDIVIFLGKLIKNERRYIKFYNEEDLKINFIAPVLNRVNFKNIDRDIRAFYEEKITYKTEKFIFSGATDFVVSKGFKRAKQPYFFIQEFKKGIEPKDPEPQLLAELISGVELNNWETIKGAYIVGSIWNFVILEKLGKDKYQYFVSPNFDSTKIEDLKGIYKNLLFVKNEIINYIKLLISP